MILFSQPLSVVWDFDPVFFAIGSLDIRYYGLMWALAILIGAKGKMLKEISQRSREDMEAFLGNRVYLELWVKVRPKWREKEGDLKRLGLAGDRPQY